MYLPKSQDSWIFSFYKLGKMENIFSYNTMFLKRGMMSFSSIQQGKSKDQSFKLPSAFNKTLLTSTHILLHLPYCIPLYIDAPKLHFKFIFGYGSVKTLLMYTENITYPCSAYTEFGVNSQRQFLVFPRNPQAIQTHGPL